MYDELIKRLREVADEVNNDYDVDPYNAEQRCLAILQAADAIAELQKAVNFHKFNSEFWEDKYNSLADEKWIPVTERLPVCDLGAEVGNIEWISCGMVNAGCFGRGGKYRDAYFRTWTDAGEGMDAKNADYWRAVTLPEPPKEE